MPDRRVVCLLLDSFIVTVERRDRPHLHGKPVIVGGDPKRRGLVVAASPEATAFGVATGMLTWEALRLCPQAVLLQPHPDVYHNLAQLVLGILSLYSDHVEHSRLDCFYMAVPGADVADLMADVQRQLAAQLGLSASIGIAGNKLVAYIAAHQQAPAGLTVVAAGQEASFLAPLSLDWVVADPATRNQLKRLGLRTIGDLAQTPEHVMRGHVGEMAKTLLRHAQGKDTRAVRSTHERQTIEWEHVFERTVTDAETLHRWVAYLVGRVGQEVRARGRRVRSLTLTLGHLDAVPSVFTAVLPKPTDLDRVLRDAAFHLLAAWDGRTVVASLGLEAATFADEPGFQLDLFAQDDTDWEEQQRRLDKAKNGLNKRYGQGTVMAATLLHDDILATLGKRRHRR